MSTLPAVLLILMLLPIAPGRSQVAVGRAAPDFHALDQTDSPVSLQQFRGRYVFLEWSSSACPCVGRHYEGYIQEVQSAMMKDGAAWIVINSTARGRDGYLGKAEVEHWLDARNSRPTAYIRDADGVIGRAYGAKSTPHIFLIDPAGTIIFSGALDDNPTGDPTRFATAKNYLLLAFADAKAGRPVQLAWIQPYGCPVKYPCENTVEAVGMQQD